jgi:hypothetical protein
MAFRGFYRTIDVFRTVDFDRVLETFKWMAMRTKQRERHVCPGHRAGSGMSQKQRAYASELHGLPSPECRVRLTFDKSPVRESRSPGSVRGAGRNPRPYRDLRAQLPHSSESATSWRSLKTLSANASHLQTARPI